MTQIATVEKILDDTHAEISVPRKSACGHDCEECAGCGVSGVSVYAKALNTVGAQPGQKVRFVNVSLDLAQDLYIRELESMKALDEKLNA